MKRFATWMVVALWIAGCGGPMEGEDWGEEDVAFATYAATTTAVESNLCYSCDLNEDDCIGERSSDGRKWTFSCQPKRRQCDEFEIRQCTDCDEYQYCTAAGAWSSCRPFSGTLGDCEEEANYDLWDVEDRCNYPTTASIKVFEGSDALTCTTTNDGGGTQTTEGYADLKATIKDVKVLKETVEVEVEVCNIGDQAVTDKTDIRVEFSDKAIESKTFEDKVTRLDKKGGSKDCEKHTLEVEIKDKLDEESYKATVRVDSGKDLTEGSAGEDNNEATRSFKVGDEKTGDYTVRVSKLDCEADDDGEEIKCEVKVCYNEDKVRDTSEIKVGVYFGASSVPGCRDTPKSDEGEDFRLSDMKSASGDCRTKKVDWEVKDEDETAVKVFLVADIDCEFLEKRDDDRYKDETVRLKGDKADGTTLVESSNCQLGSTPLADVTPLLLLALLALARRRR